MRVIRWMVGLLGAAALVGVGWWAGQVTLAAPAVEADDVDVVLLTVEQGTVGRSLSLSVTVEQPFVVIASNRLAGTVTSVAGSDMVEVGDVLYAVDAIPIRVVAGSVPFWRDLAAGVEGEDVEQFQAFLTELGFYDGEVDGRFGAGTGSAVRAWQRESGLPVTGSVGLGELVAVPELPARVRLDEQITTAAQLSGGEPAVSAPSGEIDFQLVVSSAQAAMMPPDATVTIAAGELTWEAVVVESTGGDDGNVHYTLQAPDGGLVCGEDCDVLPAEERTTLQAQVVVVPEVTGPTVPAAAVRTDPEGSAHVVLDDSTRRPVEVVASANGMVVVDGVEPGERVRVVDHTGDDPDVDDEVPRDDQPQERAPAEDVPEDAWDGVP